MNREAIPASTPGGAFCMTTLVGSSWWISQEILEI